MTYPELFEPSDVLNKLAKKAYVELKGAFPSEHDEGKWKNLDDEDQDYYRAVAASVLHALVDHIEDVNPGERINQSFTLREVANELETTAAAR